MTSLNNWRHARGFSARPLVRSSPLETIANLSSPPRRHIRPPTPRRRSRRHRPPDFSLPDLAFHLSRYPPQKSPRPPILLLSETDRDRHVTLEQQRPVPDLREEPVPYVFQDGVERQSEHGRVSDANSFL